MALRIDGTNVMEQLQATSRLLIKDDDANATCAACNACGTAKAALSAAMEQGVPRRDKSTNGAELRRVNKHNSTWPK